MVACEKGSGVLDSSSCIVWRGVSVLSVLVVQLVRSGTLYMVTVPPSKPYVAMVSGLVVQLVHIFRKLIEYNKICDIFHNVTVSYVYNY